MPRGSRAAQILLTLCLVSAPLGAQAKLAGVTKDSTLVAYDDDGVRIHSTDGRRQLKLRGYVALDGRFISSDRTDALPNTFAVRRARLIFDLNINPWMALRVMPDLAVTTMPGLADAFVDVTLGDAMSSLPFPNNVATTSITGANLWKALENGVSGYPTQGRFPQISGFAFSFDPTRPEGSRVTSVTLPDGTPIPADDHEIGRAHV